MRITPAADDVNYIALRLKQIEEDRIKVCDPEAAESEHLDYIGNTWGVERVFGECDLYFRARIVRKAKGE